MSTHEGSVSRHSRVPVWLKSVVYGLVMFGLAANVWPVLLRALRMPLAAVAEAAFLAVYCWWAGGNGSPYSTQAARANAFRRGRLSTEQWTWGMLGAVLFAVTIHAAIFLLFRFEAFPMAAFRRGYDLSFIPTLPLKWMAVVVSAASAGICEETGFRGYMQRPMEQRYGAAVAILVSSLLFMAVHLTKAWALVGMVPIVLGAGVLLGLLARSSQSLIPCMVGHTLMDIGLFAYWWTGIAGDFTARPISETGVDRSFLIAVAVFGGSLFVVLVAISRLRRVAARVALVSEETLGG
jgi:membrane protease YdiL (CAAX protease family)